MKKIYIGGSLFTEKEIKQRMHEEVLLDGVLENVKIYNPITNDDINDKTLDPTAKDIFNQDTKEILSSNIILADLDDNDIGLAMELGIAYGCNYLRDKLIGCLVSDDISNALEELIQSVPEKRVYATCSDIRQQTNNEKGIYKSWGINQFLIGGVEQMGYINSSLSKTIHKLIECEGE